MTRRQRYHLYAAGLLAVALTGSMLTVHGCSTRTSEGQVQQALDNGSSTPISQLPFIDASTNPQLLGELLARPTRLGETTALQVPLPPPHNSALANSLVRVIGETDSPQVVFSSDALVRLGLLGRSPGPGYFTAFVTLSSSELARVQNDVAQIASGAFGRPTTETVLFSGRSPVARTNFPNIDPSQFSKGVPTFVNKCSNQPTSTLQAWGQALFITDPAVVLNGQRTWDPCTGAGTQGGVWTFAHLIREMANGSGKTPEDFVKDWLSLWLNNYTVNGDVVLARTQMFDQVILPWATASGVTATLVTDPISGQRSVNLSGPLNLNIAPYRLLAIVNRIDLGETTTGATSTYGTVTGMPVTSGELRFVFGVVQPNPWGAGGTETTCGRKEFTTIFEYGVPGTGCSTVVNWAKQWTALEAMTGFTNAYFTQLESMTESVVLHGAAPAKGNQNAINQVRTNEIALACNQWEMREFRLTDESPVGGTDVPSNGELRTHTVAQTPNEAAFSASGADPDINNFVNGPVTLGLELPVSVPNHCSSSYTVPFFTLGTGKPFRGGNALEGPAFGIDLWKANSVPALPSGICARHQFSLNTCHGCHRADTGTDGTTTSTRFVHVEPTSSIPVTLSKFLTGGGPGLMFNVTDTQFGAATPQWPFMDLHRRLVRLFEIASCTSCIAIIPMKPALIDVMKTIGPIPVDIDPKSRPDLKIGPITDLATTQRVYDLRSSVAGTARNEPVDVLRSIENIAD